MAGKSFPEIARLLGCSVSTAYDRVMTALKNAQQEPADNVRQLELARLDALYWSVFPEAVKGIYGAVDRCIRIMERRARLLGLDSPVQMELSGPGGGPVKVTEVIVRGPGGDKAV